MALSGHTREFALADVIQVKALQRSDCRIVVDGPAGPGELVLEHGHAVHAAYGGLEGVDAAYELLIEDDLRYRVESDAATARRSMRVGAQELMMEAMRLLDEGRLPRIPRRAGAAGAAGAGAGGPRAGVEIPERSPTAAASRGTSAATRAAEAPAQRPSRRWAPVAAALLALAVAGGVLVWMLRNPAPEPAGTAGEAAAATAGAPAGAGAATTAEPADVAELTGPGDEKPTLLVGRPPASPLPDRPLRPTIVCRLLIDTEGRVAEATVYRPRPDLQVFEEAALEAVRGYRFAPAERDGEPVPVWINWPVDFV